MGELVHGANASLDGHVDNASGSFVWSVPGEEVHESWNEHEPEKDVGAAARRRMHETLRVWKKAVWSRGFRTARTRSQATRTTWLTYDVTWG